MKKLVIITCTTMMVMFGLTGIAQADVEVNSTGPYVIMNPASEIGPFVSISATSDKVEFGKPVFSDYFSAPGQVLFPSLYSSSSAALTVHVESNCLHGPIVASMTSLRHSGGSTITPDCVFIKAPAITDEYSSMARPVKISETQTGSHDIELLFKLQAPKSFSRAGRYTGSITFTVMPPTR